MSTAPLQTTLPAPKALRDLLLDLLGRDVDLTPADHWAPTPGDPGAVAVYVDDRTTMRALIACDLELSAVLGSAIALIPAHTAKAAVEDRHLNDAMLDNLHEVLNILAALFNLPDRPHLKLHRMHEPGEFPPADVSAVLRSFAGREDLRIQVGGYGGGRIALVLA